MLLAALLLLGARLAPPLFRPPPQGPRDVLVVMLDDVGWDAIQGMPTIQALAADSLVFQRFYSFPVCSPTRFAAFTGAYPRRAGIGDIINAYVATDLPSPVPERTWLFLPEILKAEGYATGFAGKWHLGDARLSGILDRPTIGPFVHGFDESRAMNPNSVGLSDGNPLVTGYYGWHRSTNGALNVATQYATDVQVDEFLGWWNSAPSPKLGWLALNAAHSPYDVPPGYTLAATTRDQFLDVLRYADTRLADVVAAVDLEQQYLLFLSDNGTPNDARLSSPPSGQWKGSTYEGGVRVPFFLAGPGITPGTTTQLVSCVDIAPTICDLLDVPVTFLDGRSVFDTPRTFVFTERYDCPGGGSQPEGYDDVAVIESIYKLRRCDADGIGPGASVDLVYHLTVDPLELNGQAPSILPTTIRDRLYSELASIAPRAP